MVQIDHFLLEQPHYQLIQDTHAAKSPRLWSGSCERLYPGASSTLGPLPFGRARKRRARIWLAGKLYVLG